MYVYVTLACLPGVHRGQEGVLDPMELESEISVSRHRGAGTHTWVCPLEEQPVF